MPREKALVTPSVLRWARETHGLDVGSVAAKLKRDPDEIESWETGEDAPTLAQARAIAKLYRRPLAVFFLPAPPDAAQPPSLPDFRRLPAGVPADYVPELRLLIRLSELRQEWLRAELRDEGRGPLRWVGSARDARDASELAARIRRWLDVSTDRVARLGSNAAALRLWIDQVEARGAFVFQSGGPASLRIEPIVARGFALTDRYAPMIMLNGADSEAGRIFTLLHEVVHLWVGEPGVSNLEPVSRPRTREQRIEQFCNRVAAHILVPIRAFDAAWLRFADLDLREALAAIAKQFKVSREVIARRATETRRIDRDTYASLRAEFAEQWERQRGQQRNGDGGPSWHLMVPKRAGYALTRRALNAFSDGRITGTELAELLNSRIHRLPDIAAHADVAWPDPDAPG